MIVKDIIYSNLLQLLKNLTLDGTSFETFYDSRNDIEKSELIDFDKDISGVITDLQKSKLNGDVHTDFENLLTITQAFESKFESYPNSRFKEIFLLAKLIPKLNEAIGGNSYDINVEEIDVTKFSLEPLKYPIHHKNYYYSDPVLENSLVLIDLADLSEVTNFIVGEPFSIDLTGMLLSKIGSPTHPLDAKQYALVTKDLAGKSGTIYSFVCLHITSNGYYTHLPYKYSNKPNINAIRKILPQNHYQQFKDSLTIISEYNYHEDILDKYLRLYHLIENFMWKYPLVQLEHKSTINGFSIRDFKRMYQEVGGKELPTLKNLFKEIFEKNYTPGVFFRTYILNSWKALDPSLSKVNIETFLSLLSITKSENKKYTFDGIDNNNISILYSQLIYAFRNSLVHNRETEFHLTHETLLNHPTVGNIAKDLLEIFIIPTLEEISFYLIIEKNTLVWYNGSSLKLWAE